ncbi:hypothetical protein NDU88_004477 [Pleurodeles waltl]|uniref:Uncharacterized protein n=1 Tax=Pleurodeles waltl TaxID=8319 RepID=A0AAV7W6R8_PLEWA|nr:hypothetical protein NDU88_004477 [Pleurodeles waltl]
MRSAACATSTTRLFAAAPRRSSYPALPACTPLLRAQRCVERAAWALPNLVPPRAMPRLRCLCYCDSPAPGETLILPLFCGRTPQRRGTRAEMHPRHCCSPGNRTHTAGASVEREA